jgi:hypothetical protein
MTPSASEKPRSPFVPPVFLVNTALRLRRFFLRAADAVVPSYMALLDRFMGAADTSLLHAAAHLRIADHLAAGPLDVAELATRTGTTPEVLERTLRALVAIGVFRRQADGRFTNNRVSSGLISGAQHSARGFVEFFGLEPMVRAWTDLPAMLHDGNTAFERVNGRGVWDWMAEDAGARAAFVEGMSAMTEVVAPAIAAAYPFEEVKTVCDVGGGVGIALAAALTRHPHLRGVLFDSEAMLGEARPRLAAHGVAERVELVAGSFFESIPRGADAYLLKTVIHNWDDGHALRILRNCRAAMDSGHRLLVADFLDVPNAFSTLVPYMDIAGMMIFGGRERPPDVLSRLFAEAGFRFGRTLPLPGVQAVFEGIAV